MKYFCTETEQKKSKSSCYLEFQKGRYANKCWLEDSICLHDDIFEELCLYQVLCSAIPQFDHWGITEVSLEQWQQVKNKAEAVGGEVLVDPAIVFGVVLRGSGIPDVINHRLHVSFYNDRCGHVPDKDSPLFIRDVWDFISLLNFE